MRILKFIVDGQTIRQDPSCDFSGLVPGTEQYLQAEFRFSSEWDGYVTAAAFYSRLGNEYEPQLLTDCKRCVIPSEALTKTMFKVQVKGKKGNSILRTNRLVVYQNWEVSHESS